MLTSAKKCDHNMGDLLELVALERVDFEVWWTIFVQEHSSAQQRLAPEDSNNVMSTCSLKHVNGMLAHEK